MNSTNDLKNITLIGMPFSGKSTIGKIISGKLNYQFIDIDTYIEKKYNMILSKVVETFGNENFNKIEENAMLDMSGNYNIFSTGGSVIYCEEGMKYLSKISTIIFLDLDLDSLIARMNKTEMKDRGIVFKPGQSFESLFAERIPLYKKYSHKTVNCYKLTPEQITEKIINS